MEKPIAIKWRQTNNCTIMFDLLKLIQKREEFRVALAGVSGNFSDSYHMNYGCEGDCSGSCSGSCDDTCSGGCEGCGNCGSN